MCLCVCVPEGAAQTTSMLVILGLVAGAAAGAKDMVAGAFGLLYLDHVRAPLRNSSDLRVLDLALSVSSASFRASIRDGLAWFAQYENARMAHPFPLNAKLMNDFR